jgi:hypothetical protein
MSFPEDAIPAAAFLFEQARGVVHRPFEAGEIQRHGLDGIDPELLTRELRYLIAAEHRSDSEKPSTGILGTRQEA